MSDLKIGEGTISYFLRTVLLFYQTQTKKGKQWTNTPSNMETKF